MMSGVRTLNWQVALTALPTDRPPCISPRVISGAEMSAYSTPSMTALASSMAPGDASATVTAPQSAQKLFAPCNNSMAVGATSYVPALSAGSVTVSLPFITSSVPP